MFNHKRSCNLTQWTHDSDMQCLEVTAIQDIPKNTEICISYGDDFDNAHFLFCYGFIDLPNQNDWVLLQLSKLHGGKVHHQFEVVADLEADTTARFLAFCR